MGKRSEGLALHKPFTSVFVRVGNDGGFPLDVYPLLVGAIIETTKIKYLYMHTSI